MFSKEFKPNDWVMFIDESKLDNESGRVIEQLVSTSPYIYYIVKLDQTGNEVRVRGTALRLICDKEPDEDLAY